MAVMTLHPGRLRGEWAVPPSKSIAHRALILSALTGGGQVTPLISSQDMLATQDCLEGLKGSALYPCRESGSTLRFMIPLALLKTGGGVFTGLLKRALGLLEQKVPRLIVLASSDAELDAAFAQLPGRLDGAGLIALQPGLAVEV